MSSAEVQINVLLDTARFEESVRGLEQVGVVVERRDSEVGVISGRVDREFLPHVADSAGVLAVEPDRSVSHPPPSSDLQ